MAKSRSYDPNTIPTQPTGLSNSNSGNQGLTSGYSDGNRPSKSATGGGSATAGESRPPSGPGSFDQTGKP